MRIADVEEEPARMARNRESIRQSMRADQALDRGAAPVAFGGESLRHRLAPEFQQSRLGGGEGQRFTAESEREEDLLHQPHDFPRPATAESGNPLASPLPKRREIRNDAEVGPARRRIRVTEAGDGLVEHQQCAVRVRQLLDTSRETRSPALRRSSVRESPLQIRRDARSSSSRNARRRCRRRYGSGRGSPWERRDCGVVEPIYQSCQP